MADADRPALPRTAAPPAAKMAAADRDRLPRARVRERITIRPSLFRQELTPPPAQRRRRRVRKHAEYATAAKATQPGSGTACTAAIIAAISAALASDDLTACSKADSGAPWCW